jgi:esterase/lipase superfamily enzyme
MTSYAGGQNQSLSAHPENDEPRRFAVVVGITQYAAQSGFPSVRAARPELAELAAELSKQGYVVRSLVDSGATHSAIFHELLDMTAASGPGATYLFYFYGSAAKRHGQTYLATYESSAQSLDADGVALRAVAALLRGAGSRNMMWLDVDTINLEGVSTPSEISKALDLDNIEGVRILLSSQTERPSYESDAFGGSILTHLLVQGLRGAAATDEGVVTFRRLANFVSHFSAGRVRPGLALHRMFEVGESLDDFVVGRASTGTEQVEVFYGTDRRVSNQNSVEGYYGSQRLHSATFLLGRCTVSIPRDHRLGQIERPNIWKFEFQEDSARHVVVRRITTEATADFFSALERRVNDIPAKQILVFVHGFNTSFVEALRRTAQIAYDLHFNGVPVLYSWPSQDRFQQYTIDEQNAEWTAPHLREFLLQLARRSGARTIHIVAHSMGTRPVLNALGELITKRNSSSHLSSFGQVILAAPDIDVDVFGQLAVRVRQIVERITIYASSRDQALAASARLHGYPRVGTVSSVFNSDGVDAIDASAVDTTLSGHSYYADNRSVLSDLYYLLRERKPPQERFGMRSADSRGNQIWVFQP